MYNQAPQYGSAPAPQNNQSQGQYEKNPNGGYLNPSQYGQDAWWGKLTLTPELTGLPHEINVMLEVKDVQISEYGPCRRVVAKPYTPKPQANQATAAPQAPAPSYTAAAAYSPAAPAAPAPAYNAPVNGAAYTAPAPIQHAAPEAPAGTHGHAVIDQGGDEIPF